MMTGNAAGHKFEDGRCVCGRRWVYIMDCTHDSCIGLTDVNHDGTPLTLSQIWTISDLRRKQDDIMANMLGAP